MTVAERIIEKCGGVRQTAYLAKTSTNYVHRWKYQKDKGGTGGQVPRKAQENLLAAAKAGLVDIKPADFFEAV